MARGTGKSGPDPYLGYTPVQAKLCLSSPARKLLRRLAEGQELSNSDYIMTLLAREAGIQFADLKRDDDQEALPQTA